ncbi:MAG: TPM domain-containing protein [Pseudomonadota bacterium]
MVTDFKRLLRHLMTGGFHVRRRFPPGAFERIEAAIREEEATHRGEICFALEAALPLGALRAGLGARARAIQVFSELRVWDTEENNGVLIYLLLADQDVEIVADRGIHRAAGAGAWEAICHEMEAAFREGRFEEGVVAGIRRVSELLRRHFPAEGGPRNELPDRPVVLGPG